MQKTCSYCGLQMEALRATKRFCSPQCTQRSARGWPKKRQCRHCSAEFEVKDRADANRQHCSKQCAKNHNSKTVREWQSRHPEEIRKYSAAWRKRNPSYFSEKKRAERQEILVALGGQCVVCHVTNPAWLHIDFVTGSRGLQYRHPRHRSYVLTHLQEFRVLCANHHYELTLTGRIEGTNITQ